MYLLRKGAENKEPRILKYFEFHSLIGDSLKKKTAVSQSFYNSSKLLVQNFWGGMKYRTKISKFSRSRRNGPKI